METRARILVLDDDADVRKTLAVMLEAEGYEILPVADGARAVALARETAPAAALIDIRLEGMSGLEVMREIREYSPATECIVVTGHASQASAVEAVNLGAYGYVVKPYEIDQLLLIIRRAIEKRRSGEALRQSEAEKALILETVSELVSYQDRDLRIIWANRAAAESVGAKPADLIGRRCYQVWNRRSSPCTGCPVAQAIETGQQQETEMTTPDNRVWFVRGYPVRNEKGAVTGAVEVTLEVTARKRAQQEQQKFVSLVEHSSDFIGMATMDGRVTYLNEAGRRLVGLESLEEALTTTIFEYAPGELETRLRETVFPLVMKTGRWEGEGQLCHQKTAALIDVEISTFLVRDPETDKPLCIATIQRDITERKRAQEALRRSEARYRDLVDHSHDVVWRMARDGRFTFVSPAAVHMIGYHPDELVGSTFERILTEDSARRARASLEQRLGGELGDEAVNLELWVRRKDGTEFVSETRSVPIAGPNGEVVEIEGVTRDISERKQAEEALRAMGESERRFRTQLANLLDVTNALTAAESVDELCRQAVELGRSRLGFDRLALGFYGAEGHCILGSFGTDETGRVRDDRHVRRPIPPDSLYAQIYAQKIPAVFESGVPLHNEKLEVVGQGWHAITALWDGDRVIGCLTADNLVRRQPASEDQLKVLTLFGSALGHLCSRKRAEEALRESEEMYRILVRTSPDAVTMTDLDGRITYASQQTVDLHGFDSAEEMVGKKALELVSPEDLEKARQYLQKTLTEGVVTNVEYILLRKDGTQFAGELSASLVRDAHGHPKAIIGTTRDITDRKKLEAQLRQAVKMEAVGQLAGGIAHDFNNLLTAISGYADLGSGIAGLDERTRQCFSEIQVAAAHATALTRQLLAFSRRQPLAPQVINVNDIVVNMERMLPRVIGEDIELLTRPAEDLWPVRVDPGQLEQVIVNLAVNARDAMPDGGNLTLETANVQLDAAYARSHPGLTPGEYVALVVSDTGYGMTEEVKVHLFEPFYTTKETGKGTGLGLATCYGIIKQSGGYIWVYSEPQKGTSFKIYLPRVVEEPISVTRHDEAAVHMPRGTETILLVEDEELVRSLAAQILREQGYTVLEAANGQEALRVTTKPSDLKIDLVLTDVVMPQMGGKDLVERLAARQPGLKVLFTSGYTDDAIVHHGVLVPGVAFLQKPFTPAVLARKVREVIDS